ncbi:hypothetical protein L4174_021280 [Photobacterium sp. CCB-ST2H9]|uniref:hypothetical protein n=1 Tax=Photobacterium sp. CCB-ST2H9 TaxID=2912855 RepID=UPI002005C3D2|nr:hypothetical protein [Photobacterium sp. CCB-ST2H9]UTM59241.1 hypothetical protein L4174_021280 [Photobacterium sp. CCB-ST2H9]
MSQPRSYEPVSKLTKWFCYTVAIGLIPIALRFLACIFIDGIDQFTAADFIAFGFVLHISIFNEIEHLTGDETWKSTSNTISICGIALYAFLMFALLIVESGFDKIKVEQLTQSTMILACCSFILCFVIFRRLTAKAKASQPTKSAIGEEPCSQTS